MCYRKHLRQVRRARRRAKVQQRTLLTLELEGFVALTLHTVTETLTRPHRAGGRGPGSRYAARPYASAAAPSKPRRGSCAGMGVKTLIEKVKSGRRRPWLLRHCQSQTLPTRLRYRVRYRPCKADQFGQWNLQCLRQGDEHV